MKKIINITFLIFMLLMLLILESCDNKIDWDQDDYIYGFEDITSSAYDQEIQYEDSIITYTLFESETYYLETIKYLEIPYEHSSTFFDKDHVFSFFNLDIDLNNLLTKYAIGTGVIVVTSIVWIYTSGPLSHPTPFLLAIAGAANGAVTGATSGAIIGGATSFVANMLKTKGDWEAGLTGMIEGVIDGYMWGAIFGAIDGAASGLKTYSDYPIRNISLANQERHISVDSEQFQTWAKKMSSHRNLYAEYPNGITIKYNANGFPDFSPYAVKIDGIVNPVKLEKYTQANSMNGTAMSTNRYKNFEKADKLISESGLIDGMPVSVWRSKNGYTWHEVEDLRTMILVPTEINGMFGHTGGVGLIKLIMSNKG